MHIRGMRWRTFVLSFGCVALSQAQDVGDTTRATELLPAKVERTRTDVSRLPVVEGTYIFSGKKSEVITLAERDSALTEKYARQLFAKVPGVFVYDMDGTGNQVNIAARGLDPHRSWEFNVRKDGVITNSDLYGYPASHYNVPMEAVERIELVRGTASLQYGAQFGGMLNMVTKASDTTRAFAFESINTVGSFGLLSTFNRASGRLGKWTYNVWMQRKGSDGYRDNSRSDFEAQNITIGFAPSNKLKLSAEWTRSDYVVRTPGPLNDAMFQSDPRSSTRSRNYYEPDIHVPSLKAFWEPGARTHVLLTASAVIGARNSVLFDRPATIADAIDSVTLQYAPRQVDIDNFNSYTGELRVRHDYALGKHVSAWTAGIQVMHNDLHRRQLGKGTTGTDYDLTLTTPGWGRDLHYATENVALSFENRAVLTRRLSMNTGARFEVGDSRMNGSISYYPDEDVPNTIEHRFPLFGVSVEYVLDTRTNVYGGWSQAYRPVIFKDIIPASPFESADKDLKDAYGYNAEAGVRGSWKSVRWDLSAFELRYENRMGSLASEDTGNVLIQRTNIGNSVTRGVECFLQVDPWSRDRFSVSLFTSTAWMDARYEDAVIRSGSSNVDISGNRVESAPEWTSRNGFTLRWHGLRLSLLYSYVSETFADALNTETPSASGTIGPVPAYSLVDVNATLKATKQLEFRANLNNALDEHYFTKRPQFYPGPGIWPSDGRSWSMSVALRL